MPVTVWKGQLTFGLVSIPIKIIRAARQEKIRFRQVYRPNVEPDIARSDQSPSTEADEGELESNGLSVQAAGASSTPASAPRARISSEVHRDQPPRDEAQHSPEVVPLHREYRPGAGADPVAPSQILKGFEFEKGKFAVFRPAELKRFRVARSTGMEILEFVKLDEIDPVFFNSSYYVAPETGGDKPYTLLFEAMRKTGYVARAIVAMHGREHILALRPGKHGIIMHTLFYEAEVHEADEFHADTKLITSQEMKLAELLIGELKAGFEPSKYRDERLVRMRESIAAKIEGQPASIPPSEQAQGAPVVDILEALRASLKRKPPVREAESRPKPSRKRPLHRKAGA